jgi:hypothetical protein
MRPGWTLDPNVGMVFFIKTDENLLTKCPTAIVSRETIGSAE